MQFFIPDIYSTLYITIMFKPKKCEHLENLTLLKSKQYECEECVKINGGWVNLRTCQTCGVTLCCDSSENQHARRHMEATGHQVIISAEPDEYWAYCYAHNLYHKYL